MKRPALIIIICLILSTSAFAAEISTEERSVYGIDALEAEAPEQVTEILGDLSVADASDTDSLFSRLWSGISDRLDDIIPSALKNAAVIVTIVVLCSLTESMCEGEAVSDAVTLSGVLGISAVTVGNLSSFIGLAGDALITMSDFSSLLLPCLSTAAAAGGAVSSSAAKYAAAAMFMDVLLSAAKGLILPLIYTYIAAAVANAAVGGRALGSAVGFIRWICVTSITVIAIVFTAYLSVTGIVAGTADAVTTRLTKTAIQTVLPVVGSIAADAAGAVAAGAGIIRNAVGVFGMVSVICICCIPFLRIGAHYLMFRAAAGICGTLSESRLTKLISDMGTAFGLIMALLGSGALMLFFSVFSIMKAVSG